MNTYIKDRREEGFTLIELLIAIVVVGILTAVVIVGIGGLNDQGKKGACQASLDASKAAIAVHYANTGAYPTTIDQMVNTTAPQKPELELSSATLTGTNTITGSGWTLTMTAGNPPTFSACP